MLNTIIMTPFWERSRLDVAMFGTVFSWLASGLVEELLLENWDQSFLTSPGNHHQLVKTFYRTLPFYILSTYVTANTLDFLWMQAVWFWLLFNEIEFHSWIRTDIQLYSFDVNKTPVQFPWSIIWGWGEDWHWIIFESWESCIMLQTLHL